MIEILLGQIPEALYFALFMIWAKKLETKRALFIMLMTIEYVILLNALPYSIWSHILYFIISYTILKLLYGKKCQITDIFTLCIASIGIIITSIIIFVLFHNILTNLIGNILHKILLFTLLFIIKNKLYNITLLYKKLWNRGKIKYKMKSTTFRALNVVLFNIMFYAINAGMIFILLLKGGK